MKTLGFDEQQRKMKTHPGFIAALDQSGGSTPGALRLYGIKDNAWSNEDEMFAIVHQMRTRIMTSPSFTGERIIGAILFENTMDSDIEARTKGIFGTKMRSFIKQANPRGIKDIVSQQFELAGQIIAAGLVPIIEPEVDIHSREKAKAEQLLKAGILEELDHLRTGESVMLKLTLPEQDDFYAECVQHPNVVRVVALSGGYGREEANDRLRRNHGIVASFSRALVEGLMAQQSDAEFNAMLDKYIQSIFDASNT